MMMLHYKGGGGGGGKLKIVKVGKTKSKHIKSELSQSYKSYKRN